MPETFSPHSLRRCKRNFFMHVPVFKDKLSQVHGPAAALAHLLEKVDWKLDKEGCLHVTAFLQFPTLESKHSKG